MKRLMTMAAICAALVSAGADEYTNFTVKVKGGTNVTVRARRFMPDFAALEKAHGKRVGVEKDALRGHVTWVFEDGHRETRVFPPKIANRADLFSRINRKKIEGFENKRKGVQK